MTMSNIYLFINKTHWSKIQNYKISKVKFQMKLNKFIKNLKKNFIMIAFLI